MRNIKFDVPTKSTESEENKAITNMLHNVTKIPIDFPEAAPLN